ncbi:Zinc finger, RING/FYVE/PHD-type domain containing protein [Dorcoceras hygrometricum]|uniref:Zinc finger, RING/FYVE/PHD-type domain containing protein n=1 Tax=Dorcoceras hygrometricum TaxID=472368 RepID=A0A2Z7AS75_9LAMI|nr:Zinc finger, RING/FYVE/PHD-type domain containing protein [Dorcoceras hygrometricum]
MDDDEGEQLTTSRRKQLTLEIPVARYQSQDASRRFCLPGNILKFQLQEKRAQEAKLNALDGQVAAIRNEQLEFQNKISADLLCLSTQFAEIVDYIRDGDAKKGEGGSSSRPPPVRVERRPLLTPQSPRDAVRIPTFPCTTGTSAERAEHARRHILESGQAITLEEATERVRQADIQESDRVQRERDRARREKSQHRSSSSKRRRGF